MTAVKCEYCGGYQAKPADDYRCPNCGAPMAPESFGYDRHDGGDVNVRAKYRAVFCEGR